jgi:CheY-like chemotaxis protein
MKVVLIEDDLQKAERVTAALDQSVPSAQVTLCRSYQAGLRFLENDTLVDLIILDMSLPTFDPSPDSRHGRPRPLGGYELMRKLSRRERWPAIIVLTALENFGTKQQQFTFDQLKTKLHEEFPNNFVDAIYYSQSRAAWRDDLVRLIKDLK